MTVATGAGAEARTPAQVAQDTILVLDFGSQYSQLIARRVREAQVYCELVPGTISADEIRRRDPRGIIFSGGPASVYEPGAPHPDPALYELDIPILGICYGMQLLAENFGGAVAPAERREYGQRVGHRRRAVRPVREAARRARGLDVARRRRDPAPLRVPSHRAFAELLVRRVRRSGTALRDPVPSRGRAHAARAATCCATSSSMCAVARERGSRNRSSR